MKISEIYKKFGVSPNLQEHMERVFGVVSLIEKHWKDDEIVDWELTKKMLTELGIDSKVVEDVYNKRFINSVYTSRSDNMSLKILYYGDLRALPLGIGTLEERIDEIRKRYANYASRSDFEDLATACREIEKEIQGKVDFSVNEINNESVNQELANNRQIMHNIEI